MNTLKCLTRLQLISTFNLSTSSRHNLDLISFIYLYIPFVMNRNIPQPVGSLFDIKVDISFILSLISKIQFFEIIKRMLLFRNFVTFCYVRRFMLCDVKDFRFLIHYKADCLKRNKFTQILL